MSLRCQYLLTFLTLTAGRHSYAFVVVGFLANAPLICSFHRGSVTFPPSVYAFVPVRYTKGSLRGPVCGHPKVRPQRLMSKVDHEMALPFAPLWHFV